MQARVSRTTSISRHDGLRLKAGVTSARRLALCERIGIDVADRRTAEKTNSVVALGFSDVDAI